ncbi:hypothetical protein LTR84_010335 [Exophiala bonariae]|uniref:Uncharacterized protein n=1 Tax=Exophiala bonariae TaxID=1690606 RepID=A0AAV9MWI9_9EURO|nr:hypothetical protein LTR84_010335 [Exophiala bonariae]
MEIQEAQEDIFEEGVKFSIYCLTKIQASDEDALRGEIAPDLFDDSNLEFIPWESDEDGKEADMIRIYKQTQQETSNEINFCLFADQQSSRDLSVIIVNRDIGSVLHSDEAIARAQQLVKDLKWESIDCEIDEGLLEGARDELEGHAVAYGRTEAANVYDVWVELETANLALPDLVWEGEAGIRLIPDPDWDGTAFLKKIEELKKRERDGLQPPLSRQ